MQDGTIPKKIDFKSFLRVTKWVISLVYSVDSKSTVIYFITTIFISFRSILNVYLIARIIDRIIVLAQEPDARIQMIFPYMAVLLVINLLFRVVEYFDMISRASLDYKITPGAERALYMKICSLGVQTLENPEINNQITRAQSNLHQVRRYFSELIFLLSNFSMLVFAAIAVIGALPLIIPALLVVSLLQLGIERGYIKQMWELDYRTTASRRQAHSSSQQLTNPQFLKEIFINGAVEFLDEKFRAFYDWYNGVHLSTRRKWYSQTKAFDFLSTSVLYGGYLLLFQKLMQGLTTVGTLYFHTSLLNNLRSSLDMTLYYISNLFEFATKINDTYELFNTETKPQEINQKMERLTLGPEILINNLSFSYPNSEAPVLKNINLHIKSGEKLAIVGPNGAGKTTLVKLICRMYDLPKGSIIVNGADITEIDINDYYKNLGVLFQDFNTYQHLTVKENIVMGSPKTGIDEDRLQKAAVSADALDFIDKYPNKFDQILSERFEKGIRPSSGQWQKIAIARFFYRNAPLVIFDEPTAAIDAISEYNIFNEIYKFFKGKTVIIISHRFSTVRNADRILVVKDGEIVEEGTHQDLVEKDAYYAESFRLQAEGYQIK